MVTEDDTQQRSATELERLEQSSLDMMEEISRSTERYRLLAENVADVIWTADLDLNFTYVTPSIESLNGFTPDEALGKRFEEILTEESLMLTMENVIKVLGPILEGKADPKFQVTLELEVVRKNGSTVWTESTISSILDRDGNLSSILGVTRDISDRKEYQEALKASESKYRLLAQNTADIIFVLDTNLKVIYLSPSFKRYTGFTMEEMKENGWPLILTPESYSVAMEFLESDFIGQALEGESKGKGIVREIGIKTKDGKTKWIEVNFSISTDEKGEFDSLIGVARDIMIRRATERRYRDAKNRAELYLDIMSHDIHNINWAMATRLEWALSKPDLDPEMKDIIESSLEQSRAISSLVSLVRIQSKIKSSKMPIKSIDCIPLIKQAMDLVKYMNPTQRLSIMLNIPKAEVHVQGNELLLDIFVNLLDNAVKHSKTDTPVVNVGCEATSDGKSWRLTFEDNGPGIPIQVRETLLDESNGGKEPTDRTGLGLYIIRQFVNWCGGTVTIEDLGGGMTLGGTRVVVTLPRAEA